MSRVAAYDCGTNTLRLLIADIDPESATFSEVLRRSEVVRLGQGVDRTGVFAAEALERTFRVLDEYAEAVDSAGADTARFVATSASRDVANRDEFAAGVRARTGVDLDVISGDEEARLSFDGATRTLDERDFSRPFLVVDIGGGSTELVTRVGDSGPVQGKSLDIGSVRMTERHLAANPPVAGEIAAANADIESALDGLDFDLDGAGTLVGVAGTATTMAAMVLGLDAYDRDRVHRAWLPAADLEAAVARILAMTVDERRRLPFMAPGREDVIAGGALILQAVVRRARLSGMITSEQDILDGIAWSIA